MDRMLNEFYIPMVITFAIVGITGLVCIAYQDELIGWCY